MVKRTCLFVVVGLLLSVAALGAELPVVLQPSSANYSASQLATLNRMIADLEGQLNNYRLASRRYFPTEWRSAQFAAYTAGILNGMGYETTLVAGSGWPEGDHTWILVRVALDQTVGWIPIEACPETGHAQQILGVVRLTYDASGSRLFDSRYLGFDRVLQLPPNVPPVARIRPQALGVSAGESVQFLAVGSYDPDGEIVLCLWEFGDGETGVSTGWTIYHDYDDPGLYTARLTVVDNRGAQSTPESVTLNVVPEGESAAPGGGCGCGK